MNIFLQVRGPPKDTITECYPALALKSENVPPFLFLREAEWDYIEMQKSSVRHKTLRLGLIPYKFCFP